MRLLVTGGAGFVGANFIRYWLEKHPDWSVINFDKLTYAGNLASLTDIAKHVRYRFVYGDIADATALDSVFADGVDIAIHFAAESHVDRSIASPDAFVQTNVVGTQQLLEAARKHGVQKLIQVSTDEVYGSLGTSSQFTEQTSLAPNSPYAASKASADLLARAYYKTYHLPVVITRCSNNYGPFQYPEKLIPLVILRGMKGQTIPLYGDGLQIRDWLHVTDHIRALDAVIHYGIPGETYNIGGQNERTNLEVAKTILNTLHQPEALIQLVSDRPGHDAHYAISAQKIRRELGWSPQISFEQGLQRTIDWYRNNPVWCKVVQTQAYHVYMSNQYANRLDDVR